MGTRAELPVSVGGFSQVAIARHVEAFEAFESFAIQSSNCPGLRDASHALEIDSIPAALDWERSNPSGNRVLADMDGLYKAFGDMLPLRHRIIFHGVAMKYRSAGYVFTASSGTGKSTHAFLWQRYLGRAAHILSGDKPVVSGGGECASDVTVWGSPWGGKERIFENDSAPLRGVCLIRRGRTCSIRRVEPLEFLDTMLRQTFMPYDEPAASRALEVIDAVLTNVPLWELTCNISEDAVRTSFEALTGLSYEAHRI